MNREGLFVHLRKRTYSSGQSLKAKLKALNKTRVAYSNIVSLYISYSVKMCAWDG